MNDSDMETQINDGGPAYPMVNELGVIHYTGMSLRDYFAGQALTGLYASGDINLTLHEKEDSPHRSDLAKLCYDVADSMLSARNQTEL